MPSPTKIKTCHVGHVGALRHQPMRHKPRLGKELSGAATLNHSVWSVVSVQATGAKSGQ